MARYLTYDLILDLIVFQAVLLLVILSSVLALRRARRHAPPARFPRVSVLVPARDEEDNIDRCLRSLLAQQYPDFEVLALDDHSSDATPAIIARLAAGDPRLRPLAGQPLPVGWLGKPWACAQLAQHADGELLLFTDADTFHRPQALAALVTALEGEQAGLLTGFPGQRLSSWGERLMVPFFSWATFSFTPFALAHRLRLPFLASAVGQMLLFRRSAYQAVGGHAAVRAEITEDLALARRVVAAGQRWRAAHISDLVTSWMYRGSREAFQGFSRNFFSAFGFRLLPYLFIFTWLGLMFLVPPAVAALALLGRAPLAQPAALAACIALSLLVWAIPYRLMGFGTRLALLYPVSMLLIEVIALRSLWLTFTGQLTWKGRGLGRMRWRWL